MADPAPGRFGHPRWWPTWIGLGFMRAVSLLPLPVIAWLGGALGMLLYALHAGRRNVVRVNIRLCFPQLAPAQRERLVRRHFRAFGQCVLDIGIAWWSGPRRLARLARVHGREHLDRALADQQPVILLAPHFVGLDIGWAVVSRLYPSVGMYRHVKNPVVDRVAYRGRCRFGGQAVEIARGFASVVRALRRGRPFYYLPDQDLGRRRSVFAPFFGVAAATVPALGRLADLAGAVVIPCLTRQLPGGRGYEVRFGPPLANFPAGDPVRDATRMNSEIESAVREMPEQYVWVHKRFKTRPPGEAKPY